ncbi:MAG TPA: hypothetical protein VGX45_09270 [Solirubrobacteraceae bacterium]|nr:hypothetical protein [Solirubrobacteraceae bacterium]
MSGWRKRTAGLAAGLAVTAGLAACGSGARQDANEPNRTYQVQVSSSFPVSQRLAQSSTLVITVRNMDPSHTIPDVAVTICNVTCGYSKQDLASGYGTSVEAFAQKINYPTGQLASDSRPVWIVDQAPNPPSGCQYSCQQGGPGGAVTAYANTWALGALKPNQTATFDWKVTAVKAGTHVVAWQVAAGLNGKAKARTSTGAIPQGKFDVKVAQAPAQAYVNNNGQVVTTP